MSINITRNIISLFSKKEIYNVEKADQPIGIIESKIEEGYVFKPMAAFDSNNIEDLKCIIDFMDQLT